MNTPVNFELAKLLKKKEFDGNYFHYWNMVNHSGKWKIDTSIWEYTDDYIEAPTIAEVVMWLYEKHGVWTVVNVNIMGSWYFEHFDLKEKRNAQFKPTDTHYDSPTEAYEAAIEYTLKNLL